MPVDARIRPEEPGDAEAVQGVVAEAFGRRDEALLVNRLRAVADPYLSWVACVGSDLVGHVLFTPIAIRSEEGVSSGMGLAPLAVSPAWQRRGVGSALVRAGLDACRRASQRVVVVLGDPRYYGRFGFEPAAARGLRYGAQATDAFQVLELEPGALGGVRGQVEYLPPFDEF